MRFFSNLLKKGLHLVHAILVVSRINQYFIIFIDVG
jgi:hypothetical protein